MVGDTPVFQTDFKLLLLLFRIRLYVFKIKKVDMCTNMIKKVDIHGRPQENSGCPLKGKVDLHTNIPRNIHHGNLHIAGRRASI